MTDQELKEEGLFNLINQSEMGKTFKVLAEAALGYTGVSLVKKLAKAILNSHPQILAEKIWEGPANRFIVSEEESVIKHNVFSTFNKIEVFIKEVKE